VSARPPVTGAPVRPRLLASSAIRFGLVGIVNTLIDVVLYTVLTLLGLPILVANFISTTAGMTFSFFTNRTFTFRAKTSSRRAALLQVVLFVLVTTVGLWVIQPLVILATTPLVESVLSQDALVVLVPKLFGVGVALVWNYVLYRYVVFPHRRPAVQA
jgi:putative flippase GtrA